MTIEEKCAPHLRALEDAKEAAVAEYSRSVTISGPNDPAMPAYSATVKAAREVYFAACEADGMHGNWACGLMIGGDEHLSAGSRNNRPRSMSVSGWGH